MQKQPEDKTIVWCVNNGCEEKYLGDYSLFRRDKDNPPQNPASWKFVARPEQIYEKDWIYIYSCFCFQEIKPE